MLWVQGKNTNKITVQSKITVQDRPMSADRASATPMLVFWKQAVVGRQALSRVPSHSVLLEMTP